MILAMLDNKVNMSARSCFSWHTCNTQKTIEDKSFRVFHELVVIITYSERCLFLTNLGESFFNEPALFYDLHFRTLDKREESGFQLSSDF